MEKVSTVHPGGLPLHSVCISFSQPSASSTPTRWRIVTLNPMLGRICIAGSPTVSFQWFNLPKGVNHCCKSRGTDSEPWLRFDVPYRVPLQLRSSSCLVPCNCQLRKMCCFRRGRSCFRRRNGSWQISAWRVTSGRAERMER